ncbi:MAG: leucine-rich repeat domain-containing protein [Lachnospiraceae bacterium]|nr:leucine-rich repeat domain-containing protein [Lachnospiraceae bacterium]
MGFLNKQLKMTAQEANAHGYFFRINGQNCKIMAYRGKESHPVIPAYINGKPIRVIGRKAFAGLGIKGVTLPDTIRVIGDMAFFKTSIERLELPGDILKIEERAFLFCRHLKEVILKPQIERKRRIDVNEAAFADTPYIENDMFVILDHILLKTNTREIELQCLDKVIRIPDSVEVIGEKAILYGHDFVIPPSVKLIRKYGFLFANNIESIVLENRTSDLILRKGAFGFCWNINYNYVSFFRKLLTNSLMPGSRKRMLGWEHFCKLHLWANFENPASWGADADEVLRLALRQFAPIECKIYFPEESGYLLRDILDISFYNNEFCVSLSMDEYFELMMQAPRMSDKVEMAICILTNAFTKKYQTKALDFLKLHINKATTLAVKNCNTYNIKFFQQYGLLKEGAGFRIKTYERLKKQYSNAAFVLLEQSVLRFTPTVQTVTESSPL